MMDTINDYRRFKGIGRPRRFCLKPLIWYGNIYSKYGTIVRGGVLSR